MFKLPIETMGDEDGPNFDTKVIGIYRQRHLCDCHLPQKSS
jgi:hypothetical protein